MRDDDIIRRAELWATGATIHDVKHLIGMYRAGVCAMDDPLLDEDRKRYAEILMNWAYKCLTEFMEHGDYRKAKRDNPLPEYPE